MICKGGEDEIGVFAEQETLSTSSSEFEADVIVVDVAETFCVDSVDDLVRKSASRSLMLPWTVT